MRLEFWKMQALGNDYVVIEDLGEKIEEDKLPEVAKFLCDRHYGVGGDGLLLLVSSLTEDARMRIFNPDGSEAEMCGNGIRCLAKYAFERNFVNKLEFRIETKAGLRKVYLFSENGKVKSVKVDMGRPTIEKLADSLSVNGEVYEYSSISLGNPHAVIKVKELNDEVVNKVGPKVEVHENFPERTNVEFVKVLNPHELEVRVWERGVGETLACGTGACASAIAMHKLDYSDNEVTVHLLGGDLKVEIAERIYLTGPVEKVFEGVIEVE